jgi:outer membrane lipoprotein-sorting protein
MEKYNAQLGDKDTYYGKLVYQPGAGRNANVRLEWQKPQNEILSVLNGQYTLCRPRLKTCYVGTQSSVPGNKPSGMLRFLSMSGADLRASFDVQLQGEDDLGGQVSAYHLILQPKASAHAGFKYAEIWVDGSGMPVMSKVVEKNEDATTVRLTGIEKNPGVGLDEFKQPLEKGVQVIRG